MELFSGIDQGGKEYEHSTRRGSLDSNNDPRQPLPRVLRGNINSSVSGERLKLQII